MMNDEERKAQQNMEAYRIIVNDRVIGVEFGRSPQHAIERYAAGSTYDATQMTAKRGVSTLPR